MKGDRREACGRPEYNLKGSNEHLSVEQSGNYPSDDRVPIEFDQHGHEIVEGHFAICLF